MKKKRAEKIDIETVADGFHNREEFIDDISSCATKILKVQLLYGDIGLQCVMESIRKLAKIK